MLHPFIIEQIRQREEERRNKERPQPRLELPLDVYHPSEPLDDEEDEDRGVAILDLG